MKPTYYLILFSILFACSQKTEEAAESSATSIDVGDGERFRPAFHFTPPSAWMNDPNGMVYYEGEYHLFYQHYPDDNVWGPMHWGHAVSTDLVEWEHLPIALYPDSLGYIFSGSAVIDWDNTTGFGQEGKPPMVAIFTHHDPEMEAAGFDLFQYQSLAYSLDKGRSWTLYDGNPVLENPGIRDFRDPKVFWYAAGERWIMSLAVKDRVHFYASSDLKSWEFLSEFGEKDGAHDGVWECPDLFMLPDEEGNEKWVLVVSVNPGGPQGGSATQYFIGQFDGLEFVKEDDYTRWLDVGADNYAGVTWSDIPTEDGRRLFIGWMSNWQYARDVPTYNWRSAMTIPQELQMTYVKGSPEVRSVPVKELDTLFVLTDESTLSSNVSKLSIEGINGDFITVKLSNIEGEEVSLMVSETHISLDRSKSGIVNFHPDFRKIHRFKHYMEVVKSLDIYIDRSSIEIFANGGELVMTELVFPTEAYTDYALSAGDFKTSLSHYTGPDLAEL